MKLTPALHLTVLSALVAGLLLSAVGCGKAGAKQATARPFDEGASETETSSNSGGSAQAPLAENPILAGTLSFSGELASITEGTVMIMATSDRGAMLARRFDLVPGDGSFGPGLVDGQIAFRLGADDNLSGQSDLGGSFELKYYYDGDGNAGTTADMARGLASAPAGSTELVLKLEGAIGEGGFGGHDLLSTAPELPGGHTAANPHTKDD